MVLIVVTILTLSTLGPGGGHWAPTLYLQDFLMKVPMDFWRNFDMFRKITQNGIWPALCALSLHEKGRGAKKILEGRANF